MPEQKRLSPVQKTVCYALLALGAVMLSLGLYSGLESSAVPTFAFASAGGSIAVCAMALALLSKFRAQKTEAPAKSEPQPEVKATPSPEAAAVRQPGAMPVPSASPQTIALRAYDKFLARGGENGHDREDWSAASRELSSESGAPAATGASSSGAVANS